MDGRQKAEAAATLRAVQLAILAHPSVPNEAALVWVNQIGGVARELDGGMVLHREKPNRGGRERA